MFLGGKDMLYRIKVWRSINRHTGESVLVYLTNDHSDYISHLDTLISVFRDNGSFIKVSIYENEAIRTAYIEYDLTKVNVKGEQ